MTSMLGKSPKWFMVLFYPHYQPLNHKGLAQQSCTTEVDWQRKCAPGARISSDFRRGSVNKIEQGEVRLEKIRAFNQVNIRE